MYVRHIRLLAVAALAACAVWALGCSLVVDLDECEDSSSCISKHGRGWQCTDDNICQRSPLLQHAEGAPCSASSGPVDDPDAFNIGVMLPLDRAAGASRRPLLAAIELAQSDFNELGGVNDRPIGLVICDTEGRDSIALQAADHLVNAAAVEAIIGPNFSNQSIDVAVEYAIPNDVVLISPAATAVALSDLNDRNLVWRTTPSDALQARAIGELVTDLLDELEQDTGGNVKLTVLTRRDDVYAQGLRDSLPQYLPDAIIQGNEHRFSAFNYQNPSVSEGTDFSGVVAEVLGEATPPDAIVILGFEEAWQIARLLDAELAGDPHFVFADAGRVPGEAEDPASDVLEGRVRGTAPRSASEADYVPWNSFRLKFNSSTEWRAENIQYVANSYDALYAIALAAAGSGFSGPEIAEGLAQLSDGEAISSTQDGAQRGMKVRGQGSSIDLKGASGELDFDENGDPIAGQIALWCLRDRRVGEEAIIIDRAGGYQPAACSADECAGDTDCPSDHLCDEGECRPQCSSAQGCASSHQCQTRADTTAGDQKVCKAS